MFEAKFSPAAERNKDVILSVLRDVLPRSGDVLEIASGTGQHVLHFAQALPDLHWLPSEPDESYRIPLQTIIEQAALNNVSAPLDLDVLDLWPDLSVTVVVVANMLHISAFTTVHGLLAGAASVLVQMVFCIFMDPLKLLANLPVTVIRVLMKVFVHVMNCGAFEI